VNVLKSPCATCPYRRDVPAGIWHPTEYAKLAEFDESPGPLKTFLCHNSPDTPGDTACRGWLTVHREGIAVRLGILQGQYSPEEVFAEVAEPLYSSGKEAAAAGLAGCRRPSAEARRLMRKLARARARRLSRLDYKA